MKAKTEVQAVENVNEQPTANAPSPAEVEACKKLVAEAMKYFDRGVPAMTTTDRRRTVKVRKGGEKYIPRLARAAVASGITPTGYSIDAMTASAAMVQQLEPLEEMLGALTKLVQDARIRSSGATWQTATLVYSMLKHVADRDGMVATAILPVKEFFATGPRGSAAKKATPDTVETAPPATGVEADTSVGGPSTTVATPAPK